MWGLKPSSPGGRSAINIRAEGRSFPDHRCLIPDSEFFLRDRTPSRSLWRVTRADGDSFYFAGIWRPAEEDWPEAFAMLATATNSDLEAIHDRQIAVIPRDERMAWLDGLAEADLLRPLSAGTFKRERVR